jgi:hypothetical protein
MLAEMNTMPDRPRRKAASSREAYQQAVIMLLGTRRQKQEFGAGEFLLRYKTLADTVKDRWTPLEDTEGLPSPDQVLTWL